MERPDLLDRLGVIVESRAVRTALVVLIILSVLPEPALEERLRWLYLTAFGLELVVRVPLVLRRVRRGTAEPGEGAFLVVDAIAFLSFLPLEEWFHRRFEGLIFLRLSRLLVLLRFSRSLVRDLFRILTRREQLQQFALVSLAVTGLAFVSAVVLSQLEIGPRLRHAADGLGGLPGSALVVLPPARVERQPRRAPPRPPARRGPVPDPHGDRGLHHLLRHRHRDQRRRAARGLRAPASRLLQRAHPRRRPGHRERDPGARVRPHLSEEPPPEDRSAPPALAVDPGPQRHPPDLAPAPDGAPRADVDAPRGALRARDALGRLPSGRRCQPRGPRAHRRPASQAGHPPRRTTGRRRRRRDHRRDPQRPAGAQPLRPRLRRAVEPEEPDRAERPRRRGAHPPPGRPVAPRPSSSCSTWSCRGSRRSTTSC
jgi:hypothetical protein